MVVVVARIALPLGTGFRTFSEPERLARGVPDSAFVKAAAADASATAVLSTCPRSPDVSGSPAAVVVSDCGGEGAGGGFPDGVVPSAAAAGAPAEDRSCAVDEGGEISWPPLVLAPTTSGIEEI